MPTTRRSGEPRLPRKFEALVALMPPRAIMDAVQHENSIEMVDRLMTAGKLSEGQELYLETWIQLIEVYEARHDPIETSDIRGIDSLRHLLEENDMSASDLARLLGVHPTMGSKILQGERSLTVNHIRKLAARFQVSPELFIE